MEASTSGGGHGKVLPFAARKRGAVSPGTIAQKTKAFLSFRGSRAGLFCDFSARETCPLRCSPAPVERESGLPPQISHGKTTPSHQSLQKNLCPLSPLQGGLLRPYALRVEAYQSDGRSLCLSAGIVAGLSNERCPLWGRLQARASFGWRK
jgi:hypothetical protein